MARRAHGLSAPKSFVVAIFVLTILPFLIFPFFGTYFASGEGRNNLIFIVLIWLGTAHVATTAFFYADRDFIPHMRSGLTGISCFGCGHGALHNAVGPDAEQHCLWFAWQAYHAWLLWHFMRQNIGMAALVASSSGENRLSDPERLAIT